MKKLLCILAAMTMLFTACGGRNNADNSGMQNSSNENGEVTDRDGNIVEDATDGMENATNDITDGVDNVVDGATDAVDDVVDGAGEAVDDVMGNGEKNNKPNNGSSSTNS